MGVLGAGDRGVEMGRVLSILWGNKGKRGIKEAQSSLSLGSIV